MFCEKFIDLTNIDKNAKNIWKLETEEKQPPKKKVKTTNDTVYDNDADTDADMDDKAERMAKLFLRF